MAKTGIPRTERIRMLRSKGMSEQGAVMASMKKSPEKKLKLSKGSSVVSSPGMSDRYPYGLRIELDDEGMKKLKLKDMPKTGSTVHLHAKAKVESTSHRQEHGEAPRRSASLQITHMHMADAGEGDGHGDGEQGNGLQDQ